MNELIKKSLWRAIMLYVYAFLGACMFYIIERKPEKNKEVYSILSRQLQQDFITQFNISINESDLTHFMERAFEAVTIGNKADWGILTGLTFTITSLTTIGYGHITPETPLGQILTVAYCCIGLPITMLTLKTLGEIVSKLVSKFVYLVETKVLCRKRPRKVKIKSFFVTIMLVALTICAGALTQIYLEDWTLIEGCYAWFASLSTIGYGDYIPAWNLLKNTDDSTTSLWFVISALSLPSLAALSVASGLLNALVEALEEFRIEVYACYKCPRCKKVKSTKFKREPQKAIFLSGGPQDSHNTDIALCNERKRAATV